MYYFVTYPDGCGCGHEHPDLLDALECYAELPIGCAGQIRAIQGSLDRPLTVGERVQIVRL